MFVILFFVKEVRKMNSVILEARSLTKEYKQTLALDHINLQIKKGKIYGFIEYAAASGFFCDCKH